MKPTCQSATPRSRQGAKGSSSIFFGLVVVVVWSCHDATGPLAAPDVRSLVTGAAANALDAEGHFILPNVSVDSAYRFISSQRAADLGLAYVFTFGSDPTFADFLQQQHGASIDFSRLSAVTRVEFAASPYAALQDSSNQVLVREAASQFLVRIESGQAPVASVSVSAYATDVDIQNSRVVFPNNSGGEFQVWGSPSRDGFRWGNPVGPEQAVVIAARSTGARVTAVPALITGRIIESSSLDRWRVTLDRVVAFRGSVSGAIYNSQTVYVGLSLGHGVVDSVGIFIALPTQPTSEIVDTDTLLIRAGAATLFEEVVPVGASG